MESYRIGLAWSTHAVRMACLRYDGIRSTLTHLVRLAVETVNISDVSQVIFGWAKEHLPQDAEIFVTLTVSEGTLFLKEVDIPRGTKSEVTSAIHWELLTKHAAFPKDSIIAWCYSNAFPPSQTAVAYAMRESQSTLLRETFTGNGWNVVAIEPFSASLHRIYSVPESVLSIDFEGNQASVVILEGYTARFATLVDLPQSEASSITGTVTHTAVATLISKVKQTLAYWQSKGHEEISKILLSGDDSIDRGLRKQIAKSLGKEVITPVIKKLPALSYGRFRDHALFEYAPAVGAAVRLTNFRYGEDLDFLATDAKAQVAAFIAHSQLTEAARQLIGASIALTVVSLVVVLGSAILSNKYQREIAQNRQFITNHPAQKLVDQITSTNQLIETVSTLISRQQDGGSRLSFYVDHTPSGISYTSVKYASFPNREWIIEGTGSREAILAFYYDLKEKAVGATITMPYSSLSRASNAAFSIHILW